MNKHSLFWGFVIVILGIILLLNAIDLIHVDVWSMVWSFALIAVGGWILLSVLLGPAAVEVEEATIPLQEAKRAHMRIGHGAGRLQIAGGTDPGTLMTGEFGGGVDIASRTNGDELDVRMRMSRQGWPGAQAWRSRGGMNWDMRLTQAIPIALDLRTGAGEYHLDLSDVQVDDLQLKTGASSTHLTLPANAGHTRVRYEGGAASLSIRVPDGVAACIRVDGLSDTHVDTDRFPRSGHAYQSSDYDAARNKIDISIDIGVGSVDIH